MENMRKCAVVTGAAGGIGRAICLDLVRHGWNIAACVRTIDERAESLRREVELLYKENDSPNREKAARIRFYAADLTDWSACESLISSVVEDFGRADALVNNAGITRDNLVLRMKPEDFDHVIQSNLSSAFYLSKAVFPAMMKARSGRIINITSYVGLHGNAGQANYAAAKAGMIGMTKAMAREFSARGVLVNAIAPGFIESPMTDVLSEQVREEIFARIPLKKLGKPQDIADMVTFLASERAGYITGQVFSVDGGMSI